MFYKSLPNSSRSIKSIHSQGFKLYLIQLKIISKTKKVTSLWFFTKFFKTKITTNFFHNLAHMKISSSPTLSIGIIMNIHLSTIVIYVTHIFFFFPRNWSTGSSKLTPWNDLRIDRRNRRNANPHSANSAYINPRHLASLFILYEATVYVYGQ